MLKYIVFCLELMIILNPASAQNPLINNQYTADPSARVFGDRVYIYPSHDIIATKEKGRQGWFAMEDYHVFSSANLIDWKDHGVIITQNNVPWVKQNSYSMWAPDCIERNGKYYFYFPTTPKDTLTYGKGFTIGVAVSNKPEGPFIPESTPIKNVRGIDPNVFIDKDGQAYLYWSGGNIYGAKLKQNMLELDSEVKTLDDLPSKGLKEGPYMFERNGLYYLTYPHVENKIERLEYAIGTNPLGPFKVMGVIMDESATGCWTNHHSIIEFKKQWYLFYHHNDYSPNFDKARSIRADSLIFNADGTIKKVIPTLRGIGIIDAKKTIQLDRYSQTSSKGVSIDFLDTADRFKGWKTVFTENNAWVQYNTVAFGNKLLNKVKLRVKSSNEAVIQIRIGKPDGVLIAEVKIPQSENFVEVNSSLLKPQSGIQNLFIAMKSKGRVEVDWLTFR
ncbi:MAG: carbohydrate-binding protein [Acinetobacter sp.]|nr:MAG: carbohydrate-binding protein [Acinetobacter sp.]